MSFERWSTNDHVGVLKDWIISSLTDIRSRDMKVRWRKFLGCVWVRQISVEFLLGREIN